MTCSQVCAIGIVAVVCTRTTARIATTGQYNDRNAADQLDGDLDNAYPPLDSSHPALRAPVGGSRLVDAAQCELPPDPRCGRHGSMVHTPCVMA